MFVQDILRPMTSIAPAKATMIVAAFLALGGCSGDKAPIVDDQAAEADEQRSEDRDELASAITCSVELDTVAHLPKTELTSDVPDASETPDEVSGEHEALGTAYRAQASTLAESLGIGEAALGKRFAVEQARIDGERKSRSPEDFALWVYGEADACPAI